LAHETRNPLSVIGGFARFLKRRHGDDPDLAPYFDSILEEAEKLERLVMGILKAGREAASDFEELDPQELLEDLYMLTQEKARLSEVNIRIEAQPSSASIVADRESLITALNEIVLNAVEASPKDAEVVIKIDQEQEWLVFSVSDRGQGIDDQCLPKIYEPFYSTKKLSSGMGLSFAKELIEAQNGYIRFDTKPGQGTTVYVYLPKAE
jgi:two-component system sporulation sensor kinase A